MNVSLAGGLLAEWLRQNQLEPSDSKKFQLDMDSHDTICKCEA